jgi:MATE family multidrug resistance protein
MKVDWRACLRIVRVGGPIGGLAMVEGGMFAVVAILMGSFGAEALAANQIVFSIVTLVVVTAVAIGEATGIRIAYGVGGGRPSEARYSGFVGIGLGAVVMVCLSIPYFAFPEILTSLFLNMGDPDNAGVVSFAATLFAIAAFFQVFDGVQAIASRALRGLQDTLVPMWIAAAGYWGIGVLGGYILGFPLGYGGKGLWWGLAMGLLAAALMLTWRFTTHSKALSHTIHKRTYKS